MDMRNMEQGCFERLHGMFAIAIWDEGKKTILLARDRLGKKPLYYSLVGETFLFASELKTIMAYPHFPRQIDHLSFMKYLFYEFIPSPHTIFRGASKLSAASYLTWDGGDVEIKKYWSPFHKSEPAGTLSEGEAIRGTLDLLRNR